MKPTSFIISVLLATLYFCAAGQAQTKSTLSQSEDDSKRQKAPSELAQQTDQRVAPNAAQKKAVEKKPVPPVSEKRRAELMAFINSHHPELRPLLNSLQNKRPGQFQAALRTLDVQVKNLQALEKRAPERYKKSLAQWIGSSKIKLLSAQLVLKKTDAQKAAINDSLANLIGSQHDLKVEQLADDIVQAKKRIKTLRKQHKHLLANRDVDVQRQLSAIAKNAERIMAASKRAADARKKQAQAKNPPASQPKKQQDDKRQPID